MTSAIRHEAALASHLRAPGLLFIMCSSRALVFRRLHRRYAVRIGERGDALFELPVLLLESLDFVVVGLDALSEGLDGVGCGDEAADAFGEVLGASGYAVLVSHGGLWVGVAGCVHELSDCGALLGEEGEGRVAQVVESEVRSARHPSLVPVGTWAVAGRGASGRPAHASTPRRRIPRPRSVRRDANRC